MDWKMALASFALALIGRALVHYQHDAFSIGLAYGLGGMCAAFAVGRHA